MKLYVFWGAEAMCEIIEEVRGYDHVVEIKVKVMSPPDDPRGTGEPK